jgi:hypothetical protein
MASQTVEITQDEKRAKIAEACGKVWHPEDQHAVESAKSGQTLGSFSCRYVIEYCKCGAHRMFTEMGGNRKWDWDSDHQEAPDYFNDLNACHEMEKVLVGDPYKLHNDAATYRRWNEYKALLNHNIHATAAQRAEAFGKALNLW